MDEENEQHILDGIDEEVETQLLEIKPKGTFVQRTLTHNGVTKTLREWSQETGIHPRTLQNRIEKYHWDVGRALSEPTNKKHLKANNYGRQSKQQIRKSWLDIWYRCGRKEFEKQLKEAFKSDALRVVNDFAKFLPKDNESNTKQQQAVGVKIEMVAPQEIPAITIQEA